MRKIINAHVTQTSHFTYSIRYNIKSDEYADPYYNVGTLTHYPRRGNRAIIDWRVRRFINNYNRNEEIKANRVLQRWEVTP